MLAFRNIPERHGIAPAELADIGHQAQRVTDSGVNSHSTINFIIVII
jgi:hypothetical protein